MASKKKIILKYLLIMAVVIMAVVLNVNTVYAKKHANRIGISFNGISYDFQKEELTLKISRDDGLTGLRYCIVPYFDTPIYENATVVESNEVTVLLSGERCKVYVWKEGEDSNKYQNACYTYADYNNPLVETMLDFDGEIEITNCTVLDKNEFIESISTNSGKFVCTSSLSTLYVTFRDNNNESCGATTISGSVNGMKSTDAFTDYIYDSGAYTYRALTYDERNAIYCDLGEYIYEYVRPEETVPKANAISWRKDEVGKFDLDIPEDTEHIKSFSIRLHAKNISNGNEYIQASRYNITMAEINEGLFENKNDLSYMFSDGYEYYLSVQTISNDIEQYAHSERIYSEVFNPADVSDGVIEDITDVLEQLGSESIEKVDADSLKDIYENASEEEKANIAEATKGALEELETNALKVSMQTNPDIRELVNVIEEMSGICVDIEVDEEVQSIVDTSSISVLGAGLNAAEDAQAVQFTISSSDVSFDTKKYKNAIPLEMSLSGVNVTDEELAIPVMVSMTIPEGIDMSKIVVLHYKNDGTLDEKLNGELLYKDYTTREIRFTVTHFSPFVLAEEMITDILAAQLYIGQDFKLIYKADVEGYSNVQMKFSSPLSTKTVEGKYDESIGKYIFEFTGIGPQCLADNIDAELICDGTVMDTSNGFSVKAYCDTMAAMSAEQLGMTAEKYVKLKTLMADMLEYGAEAQKYAEHNVETLANTSEWVADYKTIEYTAPEEYVQNATEAVGNDKITSVALDIRSVNKILFKANIISAEGVKVKIINLTTGKVNFEEEVHEIGEMQFYTNAIYATGYDDVYKIELKDMSDNVLHSVEFSSSAYVNIKCNDEKVGNLVKCLYMYGEAAQNYVN